jgi:hypothetical protein
MEFFRWRRKHGGCSTSGNLIFELQISQFTTSQIKINSVMRFGDQESGGQIKRAVRNKMDRPRFPMNCKTYYPQSSLRLSLCAGMAPPSHSPANLCVTMQLPVKRIRTHPMAFGDAMLLLQLLQERRIAL